MGEKGYTSQKNERIKPELVWEIRRERRISFLHNFPGEFCSYRVRWKSCHRKKKGNFLVSFPFHSLSAPFKMQSVELRQHRELFWMEKILLKASVNSLSFFLYEFDFSRCSPAVLLQRISSAETPASVCFFFFKKKIVWNKIDFHFHSKALGSDSCRMKIEYWEQPEQARKVQTETFFSVVILIIFIFIIRKLQITLLLFLEDNHRLPPLFFSFYSIQSHAPSFVGCPIEDNVFICGWSRISKDFSNNRD